MMPLKCRGCKYYATVYKKVYHGVVEGCGTKSKEDYPSCYVKREKEQA